MTQQVGKKADRYRAGFTLVEMVVVLGIILILVLALLPRVEANRRSSNDELVRGYLRDVAKWQEMYYGFARRYAPDLQTLQSLNPPLSSPPQNPPVQVVPITTGVDYNSGWCFVARTTAGAYWQVATQNGIKSLGPGALNTSGYPASGYPVTNNQAPPNTVCNW